MGCRTADRRHCHSSRSDHCHCLLSTKPFCPAADVTGSLLNLTGTLHSPITRRWTPPFFLSFLLPFLFLPFNRTQAYRNAEDYGNSWAAAATRCTHPSRSPRVSFPVPPTRFRFIQPPSPLLERLENRVRLFSFFSSFSTPRTPPPTVTGSPLRAGTRRTRHESNRFEVSRSTTARNARSRGRFTITRSRIGPFEGILTRLVRNRSDT